MANVWSPGKIFGVFGTTEIDRDFMATKMVANILREFHYLFTNEEWIPYYNTINNESVFASKWTANSSLTLIT
jgi:hypothetical protein